MNLDVNMLEDFKHMEMHYENLTCLTRDFTHVPKSDF